MPNFLNVHQIVFCWSTDVLTKDSSIWKTFNCTPDCTRCIYKHLKIVHIIVFENMFWKYTVTTCMVNRKLDLDRQTYTLYSHFAFIVILGARRFASQSGLLSSERCILLCEIHIDWSNVVAHDDDKRTDRLHEGMTKLDDSYRSIIIAR